VPRMAGTVRVLGGFVRTRPVLACLLAGVLLSACGGGTDVAAPAAPVAAAPAAPAAPAGPGDAVAKAAAAIHFVPADLPDFVQGPPMTPTPAMELAEERAQACVQGPPATARVARVPGSAFARPGSMDSAGTDVQVMKDATTAQQELATLDHPKVDACLGSYLAEVLALSTGGIVTVSRTSSSPLRVSPSQGVAVSGRRIEADVNAPGGQLRLYMDVVGLQHRSTVTSMSLMTTQAPPSGDERDRLVGLLVQRMATSAV
jgi:hypothetical protein